jgi:hypothetical protein
MSLLKKIGTTSDRIIPEIPELFERYIKNLTYVDGEWGDIDASDEELVKKITGRSWEEVREIYYQHYWEEAKR